jgi:hypothetical protein
VAESTRKRIRDEAGSPWKTTTLPRASLYQIVSRIPAHAGKARGRAASRPEANQRAHTLTEKEHNFR